MGEVHLEVFPGEDVRCPTCNAAQVWSDTCRRCRCDLRLLREAASAYATDRHRCLESLRSGNPHEALRHAQACVAMRPDSESRRLEAVCALLTSDWPAALAAVTQRSP